MKKNKIIVDGHIKGEDVELVRKTRQLFLDVFSNANIRVSPIYPRDKGRPGVICFFTFWEEREPVQVHQKPLEWEVSESG